jgi:4-carboxymuconolactone decarboxylase
VSELESLLNRPGLAPELRVLVDVSVRTWRADWQGLARTFEAAQDRGVSRMTIEETLLQCVLFCGFPRAIAAFGALDEHWPSPSRVDDAAVPLAERASAGLRLFDGVYGENAGAVRAMLHDYHPELHDFVLEEAYGRILSRSTLSARTRELIAVGALAAMDQLPQLVAHARGALAFGAEPLEVREALWTALAESRTVDEHMRRITARTR